NIRAHLFDGHQHAAAPGVLGLVNGAHAAAADDAQDPVATAQHVADRKELVHMRIIVSRISPVNACGLGKESYCFCLPRTTLELGPTSASTSCVLLLVWATIIAI